MFYKSLCASVKQLHTNNITTVLQGYLSMHVGRIYRCRASRSN